MPSLNQIASIIQNSINGGYGVNNERIHIDQIKDEIILTAHRVLDERMVSGVSGLKDYDKFFQRLDCISLSCKPLYECCGVSSEEKVLTGVVPAVKEVRFVGDGGMSESYPVYKGRFGIYGSYGRFNKGKSIAWFPEDTRVIIINPISISLKYISIDAIFKNPRDLYSYTCSRCKNDDDDFPIPTNIVDIVTGKMIASYLNYGRNPNQPNTQSDKI